MTTTPISVAMLATPEVIADPYPAYAALREHSPLPGYVDYPPGTVPGVDEPVTAWALLRHEHVLAAARDHATFSSRDPLQEASEAPTLMLVNTDQPLHTTHRKIVNKVFTRGRVEALRPWMRERVARARRRAAGRRGGRGRARALRAGPGDRDVPLLRRAGGRRRALRALGQRLHALGRPERQRSATRRTSSSARTSPSCARRAPRPWRPVRSRVKA